MRIKSYALSSMALITIAITSTPVAAQCNVIATSPFTSGSSMFVLKVLGTPAICMTTASNAAGCIPSNTFGTDMLYAIALPGTTMPFCNWSCTCGTGPAPHVSIDGSDGLPVELMEFRIEAE